MHNKFQHHLTVKVSQCLNRLKVANQLLIIVISKKRKVVKYTKKANAQPSFHLERSGPIKDYIWLVFSPTNSRAARAKRAERDRLAREERNQLAQWSGEWSEGITKTIIIWIWKNKILCWWKSIFILFKRSPFFLRTTRPFFFRGENRGLNQQHVSFDIKYFLGRELNWHQ